MKAAIRSACAASEPVSDDEGKDEYYFGYRTIIGQNEDGETIVTYRPLTLEDFLEPEEGDVYMQGSLHENDVDMLKSIFRRHLRDRRDVTVYSDLKTEWGIEGLPNPAPDISVIRGVRDPGKPRGSFSVPEEGVTPFFVLEVVSPRYRDPDVRKKPEIYRRAGVSEYVIVDPGLKRNKIAYTVRGYRMMDGKYLRMEPDAKGRIHSLTTGVRLGVSESGDRLVITDSLTGEQILPDEEALEIAENLARQESVRADQAEERLRQLEARLRTLGISTE